VKRIWGTVPVYPDGSALFRAPANTPLFVQPLDKHGMALQQMRSWFTAMPGEHLACVGCHEPRGDVPPTAQTEATKAGPTDITPWYGPPRGFSFEAEVQPVLDRKCVACHGEGKPVDLRGKAAAPDRKYSIAYDSLHPYVRRPGLESDIHMLPPMEFVAATSKLVQLLQKGHGGVTLTDEEWDRLLTWIDLNVPYAGDWNETQQVPPAELVARREEMRVAHANGAD
jgi:Hydrazine synthase alpha subunit middle domain